MTKILTTTSRLKRAIKAGKEAMKGQRYGVVDRPYVCPFCGHDRFQLGLLIPLLGMRPLSCYKCGHVHLFTKMPKPIKE